MNRVWGKAIQTDAKVSPVNYGGALVDVDGSVMGVLVPLSPQDNSPVAGVEWYDSGIGFAIPLTDVLATLDRLKQGKDLRAGLAGFTFASTDLFGGDTKVDRVRYDSPMYRAGFKDGDQILELDGHKVTRPAQVRHVLGSKIEGDKLAITIKRGDETKQADLTLVGHPLGLSRQPRRENRAQAARSHREVSRSGDHVGCSVDRPGQPRSSDGEGKRRYST
ncbi:MAG: PDZ/DHR/GLGF domain-containing protein [Planctomycetota bacterium]|nr:MAG: PDZ/DHR/GLGF domain-containing protein [Planctomycetota bacterium]